MLGMEGRTVTKLMLFGFCLFNMHNSHSQCTERWPNSGIYTNADDQNCINELEYNLDFLTFTTDARSAAQGLVGIALSPDANSIRYNTAKLSLVDSTMGFAISHAQGTTRFTKDKLQLNFSAYRKISEKHTLALGWHYFNFGKVSLANASGVTRRVPSYASNAFTFGLAQKLTERISAGANVKFIHQGQGPPSLTERLGIKVVNTWAVDLSMFYDRIVGKNQLSVGLTLSNLGPKVNSRKDHFDFIPSNFGLGTSWQYDLGKRRSIRLTAEINKLLVPTPERDIFDPITTPGTEAFREQSAFAGFFSSWSDAPNGFREELYEINYRLGMEMYINHEFAVRAGFYNDHPYKGGRQVFTIGLGLHPSNWSIDISYNLRARRFHIGSSDDMLRLTAQYFIGHARGH